MINELEIKRIDSVLSTYVDSEGNVDYLALAMTDDVVRYIESLKTFDALSYRNG